MKERPILFSAPMIRAILDGSKTQTRRVVKLPVEYSSQWSGGWHIIGKAVTIAVDMFNQLRGKPLGVDPTVCPYGKPGDRLWVRETFCQFPEDAPDGNGAQTYYRASQIEEQMPEVDRVMAKNGVRWKPSIHMPRAASRILLEIVSVRVERLNDCSESDALAEGIKGRKVRSGVTPAPGTVYGLGTDDDWCSTAVHAYQDLWESINGAGSWEANPWVWVIEFKKVN